MPRCHTAVSGTHPASRGVQNRPGCAQHAGLLRSSVPVNKRQDANLSFGGELDWGAVMLRSKHTFSEHT